MGTIIDLAVSVLILVFILAMIAVVVVGGVGICWGMFQELMDEIQERENKDD